MVSLNKTTNMLIRILAILPIISYLLLANPSYAVQVGPPPPTSNSSPLPCSDANSAIKFGPCPAGLNEVEGIFGNLISVMVGLGFVAMLVLIIMAGLKYLTSGGEPKALQSAHQTLVWAILGIMFMAMAWVVLQLIFNFTGINVTVFDIRKLCGPNGQFCPSPTPSPP